MGKEIRFVKGSGKEFEFENGGSIINISISKDDFDSLPSEKGYVKLTLCKRREKDEYGNTHYLKLNDYVGKNDGQDYKKKDTEKEKIEESLPF